MAGIQLRLQREVFAPHGDQLLSMVQCSSEKKGKRRDIFICLLNETQQASQFRISITELKAHPERPTDLPKKKRSWSIKDLVGIDAKHQGSVDQSEKGDSEGAHNHFELEFEKPYSWVAINGDELKKFLSTLINSCFRHAAIYPHLRLANLPPDLAHLSNVGVDGLALEGTPRSSSREAWPIRDRDEEDGSEYQAISDKEATDLMALMAKCEHAVTNADIFVEDLTLQLSALDDSNISSILQSEEKVKSLMTMLEKALNHTDSIESRLNQYDEYLEHIRDSMDKMEGKTVSIETVNANNKKLLQSVESIVKQLDLPYRYQHVLREAEFNQSSKLRESIQAAKALKKVLLADIDPKLKKMKAVEDQIKNCSKIRDKFSKAVQTHLTNLFVHYGNDKENLDSGHGQLKLARRKHIHKELMKYSELVHWMKDMDPKGFTDLQSSYRQNLCKLYDKDIKKFFDLASYRISGGKQPSIVAGSSTDLSGKKSGKPSGSLIGTDADSIHSDMSLSERERFDDVMETALIEVEDICMDEQYFSINFFRMEQIDKANPDPKKDKKVMAEAREMMAEIFPSLESEMLQFIAFYEKGDNFFTLHALVRLGKHVLSTQDTGSFLAISLGSVLVQIKRNFDNFMKLQLASIKEARVPRRQKCAILSFVINFEGFVNTTEGIFKGSERRSDLEKWYIILVQEMCFVIARISRDHAKTPAEVIKMENYHHLHALLSQMKIAALDSLKKEIKQKYVDAQGAYVTQYFGRPLEKLNVFFEGIQQRVAAGVKESEISYQLAFSKQELRKVISAYPGKEVKKGLDSLYKKVERHLCEEEGLVQVVWRAMQEEFIRQYKHVEDMIQRCYPGAQITLDFTINEVLEYFSDIARSH
ncbi:hypothetical protein TCAL_07692 [Tigriopus californicus]|uniref:Exocyst complex component Sec3 PIP2-binding N-terminal domain-containing protein n=2 Tax=Tigriopus californicus TaxID=6832 RepID=A0A553NEM6_TIGCA|nr:hypothetical protein TCAL_07692 [Tigriopus californicus]|eukprot:TCALIF_07692-PA protein Name:"Similar to sec3 Exocyst complex component 1 (Drosophila melanogaster)" AED:0.30 eAED:0.31 QI:0/-1/0/1/-1/1/1/0/873